MTFARLLAALVTTTALIAPALAVQDVETDLQRAIQREATIGDLAAVIEQYREIAERAASGNRAVAARALLRLAEAYDKQGDAQARSVYERIVSQFADQTAVAEDARRRLGGPLTNAAAAGGPRLVCIDCGKFFRATLSADGRRMTMRRGAGAAGETAIRDMASGAIDRLPSSAFAMPGVLSRDGRQIAYSESGALKIAAADGSGEPRILIDNAEFNYIVPTAWFPDGQFVLLEMSRSGDETWQIGVASTANGAIRVLRSIEWRHEGPQDRPALSPDGRYVVYSALANNPRLKPVVGFGRRSTEKRVYLVAVNGRTPEMVLTGLGRHAYPTWTADGTRVVFVNGSDLWTVGVREGKPDGIPVLLKAGVGAVEPIGVTPMGTLYYRLPTEPSHQIAVVPLGGSGGTRQTTDVSLFGRTPVWSPNGKVIAYWRLDPASQARDVVTYAVDTSEERVYGSASLDSALSSPIWSPDGSALYAAGATRETLSRIDVETADVEETARFAVPPEYNLGFRVGLSPDGRFMTAAISRWQNGTPTFSFASFDVATGNLRSMAPVEGPAHARAALSPDGETLAFVHVIGEDVWLSRIGVNGTDARKLTRLSGRVAPSALTWTRDGNGILLLVDGRLLRINAGGGTLEDTGRALPDRPQSGVLMNAALSPDGTHAAVWRMVGDAHDELWALALPPTMKAQR